MGSRAVESMRRYWDEAARANAAWYVDTSLDFEQPDMERFFGTGDRIVEQALGGPVHPARTATAVEIGSGLGRICAALAHNFDHVIGVDIAEEMVRRARELVPDERVTFLVGDGASLAGIDDGVVDFAVSFTVFQHIPDESVIAAYVAEAGRVLAPGGVFAFQWNNESGAAAWRWRRRFLDLLHRSGLRREARGREVAPFLGSKVPLNRIESMLSGAGLELAGTEGLGSLFAWAWATKRLH